MDIRASVLHASGTSSPPALSLVLLWAMCQHDIRNTLRAGLSQEHSEIAFHREIPAVSALGWIDSQVLKDRFIAHFLFSRSMGHSHTHACPVPPSPDLLDQIRARRAADVGVTDSDFLDVFNLPRLPGLDDGTVISINPVAHEVKTPPTVITNADLERRPLHGILNIVVVLVSFSDNDMSEGMKQRFTDLFFAHSRGSVSHYYAEVSRKIVSGFAGHVVGPLKLPHTKTYYANNQSGLGSRPNIADMANDAYTLAIVELGDLAQYDNDKDGYVDAFVVVHAGGGAEQSGSAKDIWSAKYNLPEDRVSPDGTRVSGFLTLPEDAQLGVCVHELGHLLFSWPDLYNTSAPGTGVGSWCVMSYGAWGGSPPGSNPVHPSAWCKMKQGWIEVVNEKHNRTIDIPDVKDVTGRTHRLWRNGDVGPEYFLLENRNLMGYDSSIPGPGLQSGFFV